MKYFLWSLFVFIISIPSSLGFSLISGGVFSKRSDFFYYRNFFILFILINVCGQLLYYLSKTRKQTLPDTVGNQTVTLVRGSMYDRVKLVFSAVIVIAVIFSIPFTILLVLPLLNNF